MIQTSFALHNVLESRRIETISGLAIELYVPVLRFLLLLFASTRWSEWNVAPVPSSAPFYNLRAEGSLFPVALVLVAFAIYDPPHHIHSCSEPS